MNDAASVSRQSNRFQGHDASAVVDLAVTWTAISVFALIAATWRLWFPVLDSQAGFPLVPFFEPLTHVPRFVDWLVSLDLMLSCLLVVFGWRWTGCILIIASAIAAMLLNQHRMQPWLYQLILFAGVYWIVSSNLRLACLRILVFSIYFFSALSKLDFEFVHTVGPQFVVAALDLLGLGNQLAEEQLVALAYGMPIAELLIALGLLLPSTRPLAGVAACGMHLCLVTLLGPWSLDHSLGVLFWNIHFAVLALLLFVFAPETIARFFDNKQLVAADSDPTVASSRDAMRQANRDAVLQQSRRSPGRTFLSLVWFIPLLCLPLAERLGYWDHWLSWALYAPHSSRVEVEVASTATQRLPSSLEALLPDAKDTEIWTRVPIGQWSLKELGAPIYPQARFQAGVARYIASALDSDFEVRASLLGVASRWDGSRTKKTYLGKSRIEQMGRNFWLNTQPR